MKEVYVINHTTLSEIADAIRTKIEAGEMMCCDFAEMIRSILQGEDSIKHGVVIREYNADTGKWTNICVVGDMYASFMKNNTDLVHVTFKGKTQFFDSEYEGCNSITEIILPSTLHTLGNSVFKNCSSLGAISIPENVTSFGDYLFYGCSNLKEVEWNPVNCEDFGILARSPFYQCNLIEKVTFGPNVKHIPGALFYNTGATLGGEMNIPEGITSTGDHVFQGSLITKIVIPQSMTSIGSHFCSDCTSIEEVVWNAPNLEDFTAEAYGPFYHCSGITKVTFGENVNYIPKYAFNTANATFGGTLTIPENVTSIGSSVFKSNLMNKVDIQGTVSIGETCFESCTNLNCVILRGSEMSTITYRANTYTPFRSTPIEDGTGFIYVPDALVDTYKADTNWSFYADQIKALSELEE